MHEITLEQIPNLWRADDLTVAAPQRVSSGFCDLDRVLGGGWPVPGLVEVLCDQPGIGELQVLLPLMQALSVSTANKPVLWINPPYEPHAIALAQQGLDPVQHWCLQKLKPVDALWAAEQCLRSGACMLLLCWLQGLTMSSLRRLKLAALSGHCAGVLFRATQATTQPTPANLRVRLTGTDAGLQVEVLKAQGRRPGSVLLAMTPHHDRLQRGAS